MKNNSKKIRGKKQDIATAQKVGTNTRTGKMLFIAYARSQTLLSWICAERKIPECFSTKNIVGISFEEK